MEKEQLKKMFIGYEIFNVFVLNTVVLFEIYALKDIKSLKRSIKKDRSMELIQFNKVAINALFKVAIDKEYLNDYYAY